MGQSGEVAGVVAGTVRVRRKSGRQPFDAHGRAIQVSSPCLGAKVNNVPVVYCSPGERKHQTAEQHLFTHEVKAGLFLVLVSKALALVWEAQQTGTGKLGQFVPKDPWPYVNHYSFHILDPDWGHVTIKMSGHRPCGAQVILNGHEYVAAQAQKAGIGFSKQENCFTAVNHAAELAKVADTLCRVGPWRESGFE